MACRGPCLPHCFRCDAPTGALAYAALAYALACGGYVALTRGMGTPFGDTLTPAQRAVLAASRAERRDAFVRAAAASVALLLLWRPLRA